MNSGWRNLYYHKGFGALAQGEGADPSQGKERPMSMYFNLPSLVSALAFVALGLAIYFLALKAAIRTAREALAAGEEAPSELAFAVLAGALALGVSIIVAAAVH